MACVIFLAFSSSAFAEDATKAPAPIQKPSCGDTVAACQEKIDDLTKQVSAFQFAMQAAMTQRDAAQKNYSDLQIQDFVTAQTVAKK